VEKTSRNVINVLIVDDSAFMRTALERMMKADPCIRVIGTASNGLEAIERTLRLKPDVITLDIEMPVMDGLHALKEIMRVAPLPVLIVSSLTKEGAQVTLDALELGAVDYLPKPGSGISTKMFSIQKELVTKVRHLAESKPLIQRLDLAKAITPSVPQRKHAKFHAIKKAVFIGASTGGPPAIQRILSELPANLNAPIIIAQHMPSSFTKAFADRLNRICNIKVKEAVDRELLQNSVVYICPGDMQTTVEKSIKGEYKFKIVSEDFSSNKFAPSIDVLMFSAAKEFGANAIGILLTGMGDDGARGLKNIFLVGGLTMAQDKETSVVFGIPRAAIEMQAVSRILPLNDFAEEIKLGLL